MSFEDFTTQEFVDGIRLIPVSDVVQFFNGLKQIEFDKVGTLSPSELTSMQERVRLYGELRHILTQIIKPTT